MQNSSSSSSVPLLNFSSLQGDKCKHPTALKVRFSSKLSLTEMAELAPITTRLSSDRSNVSFMQLQSSREALASMGQEQCAHRYAADPFFRMKMQSELKSLNKFSLKPLTDRSREPSYIPIEKTFKLIEEQPNTTYRKVKELDKITQKNQRSVFNKVIKQTQIISTVRGKENCK